MLQPDGCLANDVAGDVDGNRTDPRCDPIQLIAVHKLHHHEVDFADATGIQRAHNVGTVEQRRRADLTAKAIDKSLISRQLPRHDLHGHDGPAVVVPRLEHMSHPAFADRSQQTILSEDKTTLAFEQLIRLPLRQQIACDKFRGQALDDGGVRIGSTILLQLFRSALRCLPLQGCQQPALFEMREELRDLQLRHECVLTTG